MSSTTFCLLLVGLLVGCCVAEVVHFNPCQPPAESTAAVVGNCTVHQVNITPCPEAAEGQPCKIKRGKSASIQFDFTPDVAAGTNVSSQAFWTTSVADLPFIGMNTDACSFTQCPLEAGRNQSYSYQLSISKKFPVRTYDVKWRTYNGENFECCFVTRIKLVK